MPTICAATRRTIFPGSGPSQGGIGVIRNSELWGGLFWLGVGIFVVFAGRDMGLGGLHEPRAGFAFYWVGILMCALAAAVIGQAVLSGGPTVASLWAETRWGKVLAVVVMLLAYAVAFEPIGFIVCTVALLLALMWFVDPVRWWVAILVAGGSTAGVWLALTKWLKIQLPAGVLAGFLG
jgi:putative tricarboxylic transport membrane protein